MTTTVTLNAEQDEIRGVARSFLQDRFPSAKVRELMETEDGFELSGWNEIAELGWVGIALPEERGGAGYTIVERCLLLEEMGRVLCPVPFLSSAVLAADAVAIAATEEARAELLAGLLDGSVRGALVAAGDLLGGHDPAGGVTAASAGEGFELRGDGGMVLDGASAELLLVAAPIEGAVGLFAVDRGAAGVERSTAQTVDETRRTATVSFDGALARRLDGGDVAADLAAVLDRGAISLAAEMAGGARAALEMTVEYMNERQQFGGPIGRFQALKHRLADLHVAIDGAREAVYAAADAVQSGEAEHVPMAAASAKSAASDAYTLMTAEAVQLHGGIGFTEEHDIGLYYKRALAGAPMLGASADLRERIAVGLDV